MKKLVSLVVLCAFMSPSLFGMEGASREGYQPLVDQSAQQLEKILDKKTNKLILCTVFGGMVCGGCAGLGLGLGAGACTGSSTGTIAAYTTIFTLGCSGIGTVPGFLIGRNIVASKYPSPNSETLKNKVGYNVWWCSQHKKPIKTGDVIMRFYQLPLLRYAGYQTEDTYKTASDFHSHKNCEDDRCKNIALFRSALCKDDVRYPNQDSLPHTTCKRLLDLVAQQYFVHRLYADKQGPQAMEMSVVEEESI